MKYSDETVVFNNGDNAITCGDFRKALADIEADKCDILFVHSDLSFGAMDRGLKRKELNDILLSLLKETGVKTLMFPTFTFSFCNKEDYDADESKTKMGMLPEYVRKLDEAHRTDDPIMSVAIIGDKTGFEQMSGTSSCGKGGIFHQLHGSGKKVKFLFFGTESTKCFTFLHYVEEIKQVPYRYSKDFSGKVRYNGNEKDVTVQVYVRYKGVVAVLPDDFADQLKNRGIMKRVEVGASAISAVDEDTAYEYICELIDEDPYIFSVLPEGDLIKEFEYGNVTTM